MAIEKEDWYFRNFFGKSNEEIKHATIYFSIYYNYELIPSSISSYITVLIKIDSPDTMENPDNQEFSYADIWR